MGRYAPNAWGPYDMLSNVWEWVQDCYLPYPGAPADGNPRETSDGLGRMVRGGTTLGSG